MLLRKKTKSLIVVSLSIIGLASTSIVNARSLIASNTSLVQIESKGTHPTGSVTKGNYTVNSSILTKPSMGQAAARGILTVGSPKPAKDMGLSMTLWGTEYSLIAATPYYYNTNGTTAVTAGYNLSQRFPYPHHFCLCYCLPDTFCDYAILAMKNFINLIPHLLIGEFPILR